MNEYEIREPVQKRSIEKKEKIIESGFELICEKGYYNNWYFKSQYNMNFFSYLLTFSFLIVIIIRNFRKELI